MRFSKPLVFVITAALLASSCFVTGKARSARRVRNTNEMETLRTDMLNYARNFIGTPYRSGGLSPKNGFDCSGFVTYVMQPFDIKMSRSSADMGREGFPVSLDEARPGDLIFFSRSGRVHHVGMVSSNKNGRLMMIHSSTSKGVVEEDVMESDYWRSRLAFVRDMLTPQITEFQSQKVAPVVTDAGH